MSSIKNSLENHVLPNEKLVNYLDLSGLFYPKSALAFTQHRIIYYEKKFFPQKCMILILDRKIQELSGWNKKQN